MVRFLYGIGMVCLKRLEEVLAPFHAGARGRMAMRKAKPAKLDSPVWFHCASAGEWEQIRPVAEALHAWKPELPIVLSFYSPSGFFSPGPKFPANAVIGFPVDTPSAVAHFLDETRPRLAIFVKAEIWLHMWEGLHQRQIPVGLVAARWGKSKFLEKWWAAPWRKALEKAAFISAQDEETAHWCKTHLRTQSPIQGDGDPRVERVKAIAAGPWKNEPAWHLPAQTAIAGSIWPEDLPSLQALIAADPTMTWVVAPHKIDQAFLSHLEKQWEGKTQRWTALEKGAPWTSPRVVLMDVLGELSKCYRWGKIAYVGGGFGKQVHNILEPAVYGIPVLFGPHYQRSREAENFVRLGIAYSGKSPRDLVPGYLQWIRDEDHLARTKNLINNWFSLEPLTSQQVLEQIKRVLSFS
jgi:3-deoxy-D-manno-octulosonic-acid transferase